MKIISLILVISLLLPFGLGCEDSDSFKYEGPFYSLEMSSAWHMFDFGGDDLKTQGYYRYVTFSKRPIILADTSDINNLEYALTVASIFDSSLTEGDFSALKVPAGIPGVNIVKNERIKINGVEGRWLENEVQFEGKTNSSILLDIPLKNGYIQIDFFGPKEDVDLQNEVRKIIRTLEISNPNHFGENTQDEPWRREE